MNISKIAILSSILISSVASAAHHRPAVKSKKMATEVSKGVTLPTEETPQDPAVSAIAHNMSVCKDNVNICFVTSKGDEDVDYVSLSRNYETGKSEGMTQCSGKHVPAAALVDYLAHVRAYQKLFSNGRGCRKTGPSSFECRFVPAWMDSWHHGMTVDTVVAIMPASQCEAIREKMVEKMNSYLFSK